MKPLECLATRSHKKLKPTDGRGEAIIGPVEMMQCYTIDAPIPMISESPLCIHHELRLREELKSCSGTLHYAR